MAWVTLCSVNELINGKGKYVEVDGFHLAVFLDATEISVIDSTCPHAGANLADGLVEDGWRGVSLAFLGIRTGNGSAPPITWRCRYKVRDAFARFRWEGISTG